MHLAHVARRRFARGPLARALQDRVRTSCGRQTRFRPIQCPRQDERISMSPSLIRPHGGELIDRIVSSAETGAVESAAANLPSVELDARELADVELIATGAASPLRGFLDAKDYSSVVEHMRLADGTVWPLPLTLAVANSQRASLSIGEEIALRDSAGRLRAVLRISDLFQREPLEEARRVYGTDSPSHPGVAYLLSRPRGLVGGELRS